ncbi:forkhead box protein O1-like, partial [Microtus pennsylvanicus]|uniref:forkhead box protein O1-like n=1 Tax=Microtus pennsylvanicus TaxID=10058 RepID=UPI003F6CDA16
CASLRLASADRGPKSLWLRLQVLSAGGGGAGLTEVEALQVVETDQEVKLQPQLRSYTWPLPRLEFNQSNWITSSPALSGSVATNPDATATLALASAVSTGFMSNLSLLEQSEDFARVPS